MKCIFCLERGNDPNFSLDVYKNLFMSKLGSNINRATHLFNTGWGEILMFPEMEDFLDYLNKKLPRVTKVFTTNGVPLNKNLILKLTEGRYDLQISLHTSNPLIHRLLTQTNYFEQIVSQIRELVFLRRERNLSNLYINLIFLVTSLNIENLPDFVDFSGQLGVNSVTCNYLTIFKSEHIKLSCFFLKDSTNKMFDEAQKRAQKYNIKFFLPPRFGSGGEVNKIELCRDPWDHLFVDALGNILPCCYAGEPIGNLNNSDFSSIWNGDEYAQLRSSLIRGEPHERCRDCFKFSSTNIDDIKSHITFRCTNKNEILASLGIREDS
ncbi:MAG: radical SAM/SPASM domain-containing protein [Candidatus Omnitrophota bacterium]